jgi:hypothetical protein
MWIINTINRIPNFRKEVLIYVLDNIFLMYYKYKIIKQIKKLRQAFL